jgi:hypothetical protein
VTTPHGINVCLSAFFLMSATRRTLRAMRRAELLTEANAALAMLALTTARALDDVVRGDDKRYVVAQLSRAHLLALEALARVPEPPMPDAVDALLAEIMRPRTRPVAMVVCRRAERRPRTGQQAESPTPERRPAEGPVAPVRENSLGNAGRRVEVPSGLSGILSTDKREAPAVPNARRGPRRQGTTPGLIALPADSPIVFRAAGVTAA